MTVTDRRAQLTRLRATRNRYLAALDRTTDKLRQVVKEANAEGITEAEIARLTGVTRMTVRSWLGKGPK